MGSAYAALAAASRRTGNPALLLIWWLSSETKSRERLILKAMTDGMEFPARRCLYCDAPASSDEHIIPEAIGGHFSRRILCERHNNELGALDDAPRRISPL